MSADNEVHLYFLFSLFQIKPKSNLQFKILWNIILYLYFGNATCGPLSTFMRSKYILSLIIRYFGRKKMFLKKTVMLKNPFSLKSQFKKSVFSPLKTKFFSNVAQKQGILSVPGIAGYEWVPFFLFRIGILKKIFCHFKNDLF